MEHYERFRVAQSYAFAAKFLPASGFGAGQSELRVFRWGGVPLVVREVLIVGAPGTDLTWQADVLVSRDVENELSVPGEDQSVFGSTDVGTSISADDLVTGVFVVPGVFRVRVGRRFAAGSQAVKVRLFNVAGGAAAASACVVVVVDELFDVGPGGVRVAAAEEGGAGV